MVVHHFLEVAYPYAHTVDPNEGPVEGAKESGRSVVGAAVRKKDGLGDELAACPSNSRAMKQILVG